MTLFGAFTTKIIVNGQTPCIYFSNNHMQGIIMRKYGTHWNDKIKLALHELEKKSTAGFCARTIKPDLAGTGTGGSMDSRATKTEKLWAVLWQQCTYG